MKRKLLAVFMAAAMVVTFIPTIAFANEDEEDMPSGYICIYTPDDDIYEDTEDDYTYLYDDGYCDTVKGLSYDWENNVLTMNGYKGKPIRISGLEDITINVKKASTITTPKYVSSPYEDDGWWWSLLDLDSDVRITGSAKLTLTASAGKYYCYDDDEEYFISEYPSGIDADDVILDGSNIAVSKAYVGASTGDFEMLGGTLACSKCEEAAVVAMGDIDIHHGTYSNGYSVQEVGDYNVIGKKGADFLDDEDDGWFNSKVARTVTIKGGNTFEGTYGDFEWTLNSKGVLTITGEGDLTEDDEATGWSNYASRVKSVVIGEGIESVNYGVLRDLDLATTVTIPASVENLCEDAFDGMSKLSAVNVNAGNEKLFSKNGVLFVRDLEEDEIYLEYYPEGKKAANYEVPDGVTVLSDCSFENATVKTLTLSKTLFDIDDGALEDATVNAIKVKSGNPNYYVKNNVLYRNQALVWYGPANKVKVYTIPDGVTEIKNYAFLHNDTLRSVYVPASLVNMERCAFESNVKLDVLFMGDAPNTGNGLSSATYIVQKGTANWDSKTGWKDEDLIVCDDVKKYYPTKLYFEEDTYETDLNGEGLSMELGWDPEEAYVTSVDCTCSDKSALDLDSDGSTVYAEPLKAGTFTVTATTPTGVSGKCKVIVNPYFEDTEELEIYVGDTLTNPLVGTSSGVKWSTSNKKIATVNSKGVVKGVSDGECTIYATFQKITYEYDITVCREYPGCQETYVDYYDYDGNAFYVYVYNGGEHNFIVYSSGAQNIDVDYEDTGDSFWNRKLKLSSSSITVKPGEEKLLKFKVNGKKLYYYDEDDDWCEYDAEFAQIYCTIGINGKKYDACFYDEGGVYWDDDEEEWFDLAGALE